MNNDNGFKLLIAGQVLIFAMFIPFCIGRYTDSTRGNVLIRDGFTIIDPEGREVERFDDNLTREYWTKTP